MGEKWRGTEGREPGRIGGGRGTGGGRRKGGKRDSQSGGNREKRGKISQYCVTFSNRNRTKRREPLRKGAGSGSNRYGRWEFQTPLSPPTENESGKKVRVTLSGSRDNCLILSRDVQSTNGERQKSCLNVDTLHIWHLTCLLRKYETSKKHFNSFKSFIFVFR